MIYQITIVSDENSWINKYIPKLIVEFQNERHLTNWVHKVEEIPNGDFVFCIGCSQKIPSLIISRNKHNLIIHESDLPKGKGWSPLTWQILKGINEIPICLFEAVEPVDSGKIYLKDILNFRGTELVEDLRKVQAETSIEMCLNFIRNYPEIILKGIEQRGDSTFFRRRKPEDSRLNPDKTIIEQFNLLRVVDNENYPAFFEMNGETYILKIEKKRN